MFWTHASGEDQLHPDGYGCWERHGRVVRFFLEYDTGTVSLKTMTSKLADYQQFPTDRFGILLFSVHSARRETGLRTAPSRALGSNYSPGLVIATTSRDMTHPDGPAGSVWALWTTHSGGAVTHRLRLADLPDKTDAEGRQSGERARHGRRNAGRPAEWAGMSEETGRPPQRRIRQLPRRPAQPDPVTRCRLTRTAGIPAPALARNGFESRDPRGAQPRGLHRAGRST